MVNPVKTDGSTAIEQRSDDSATEHTTDIATEQRNSEKKPFEESQKVESSLKRQRCRELADEEQHKWELPEELSKHANKYLQKFVQDKNLEDSILNEKPVPTNIIKPRKLEEYYKELLEELHAKREIAMDEMLKKMQTKTFSIMGPLNKIWFSCKGVMAYENRMMQLDLIEMIQYLEKLAMLMGQALSVITYNIRLNVLSTVQKKQKAKKIKDQVELLQKPSANIFNRVFRGHVKETVKVKKEFKEVYRREQPEQNKQPISKGPSLSKQDGWGGGGAVRNIYEKNQLSKTRWQS